MDLELKDKVAIVTGASRGIGAAAAHVLASEGADVFLGARSGDDLAKVAAEITKSTGRRAVTFVGDFSDPGVPEAAVAACMKAYGRLDILVNNAGATKRGDFFKLTEEDWASGFGLKFYSTVRMTRISGPQKARSSTSSASARGRPLPSSRSAARSTARSSTSRKPRAISAGPTGCASMPSIPVTSRRAGSTSGSRPPCRRATSPARWPCGT
jgi:NAD(P)-dependent dehydrogenase (short-subunit alcohol dehydrogenase family)